MHDLMEAFAEREKALKSDSTGANRRSNLRAFHAWMQDNALQDPTEVSSVHLENYFLTLSKEGYAPKSINTRWSTQSRFYQYLESREHIDSNPMEDLEWEEFKNILTGSRKAKELRQDIYYLTPNQKEAMVENVDTPTLRNELLIRLLWQTGVRESEARHIRLSDLDREEREIRIRADKTHENRTVYYQRSLDILLNQWLDGGYRDSHPKANASEYVFVSPQSDKISQSQIGAIIRDTAEEAGIQEVVYHDAAGRPRYKITAHTLRHGYAVQSVKNGMPVPMLAKLMGHAEISTTEKYLKLVNDDVKKSARQYGAGTEEV